MAKYSYTVKILLKFFIVCLFFQCIFAAPTLNPEFEEFYTYLNNNHCSLPKQIKLDAPSEEIENFQFLAEPLGVCQTLEPSKHAASEAAMLCHEIYENFKNITCSSQISDDSFEINIPLSSKVCSDFGSLQISLPLTSESKIKKPMLSDNLVCEIVCTDEFTPTCQFLLWSYQVLQKINDARNNQQNSANLPETKNISDQEETKITSQLPTEPSQKANKDSSKIPESISTVSIANVSDHMIQTQLPSKPADKTALKSSDNINEKKDTNSEVGKEVHSTKPVPSDIAAQSSKENLNVADDNNVAKLEDKNSGVPATNLKGEIDHGNGDADLKNDNGDAVLKNDNGDNQDVAEDHGMNIWPNQNTPKLSSSSQSTTKIGMTNTEDVETKSSAVSKTEDNIKVTSVTDSNSSTPSKSSSSSANVPISSKLNATTASDKSKSDSEVTNTVSPFSEIFSVVPISSTVKNVPLEKMEGADNVKVPDENTEPQYVETENGDVEYGENPVDEDKQKEQYTETMKPAPDFKPVIGVEKEHPYINDNLMPNRYSNEPKFPGFPEQEDSHFFFYFVSMVLVFMAVYLLVHNKQKIIALIVEGRHERRRRSHGTGYKKLEAK